MFVGERICQPPEVGRRAPPIAATPGRTQQTPSASRSLGAELTGELTLVLGMALSVSNLVKNLDLPWEHSPGVKARK